jgi:hypothetical protein
METLRPANYHPVPAVRRHKINGVQQKLSTTQKPINLSRNSPVTKVKKPSSPVIKKSEAMTKKDLLSDDDDFYAKLTFDDTEQSLEDEIFEELEKVAHDEAKLNAAIQNFDKILNEYKTKEAKKSDVKPSGIPKPLQKSKTCSIIESKCILKKEQKKVNKPLKVENVETVTSAGYYQITKSLWNLEDFDNFAKSARHSPASRKLSEGTLSKSVWEVSPSRPPSISRQSSIISKIPIKSSSNLSTSMLQLNTTMTVNQQNNLSSKRSSVYASSLGLAAHQSSSVQKIRRSSISNYAETKASLQRRNLMNATIAKPMPLKSTKALAKSEMSIHGKFAMKAQKNSEQNLLFNDNQTKMSLVVKKRDYIAKKPTNVSMNMKMRSVVKSNDAIPNENESKSSVITVETKEIVAPTLESRDVISEVVLGAESQESIDKLKDYESDDSGHISNENEDTMDLKKPPRKISEELLEIFEKKSPQQPKAKVIEMNHVNLIKSSMEIYPTCKSEVTIYIKPY